MGYTFQWGATLAHLPVLLDGAWLTILLSAQAMVGGLVIGVVCAATRSYGPRPLAFLVACYVEFIRNTPLLIQLFFVFFALPFMGLRMTANTAALVALTVNLGAYATEIVRAGIEAVPRGQIEAGRALGLGRLQIIRFVVIFPALKAVYPALTSQFILLLLGTSIVSGISAEELTAAANTLNSRTFRSFEIYTIVAAIYVAIALSFKAAFWGIHRLVFEGRG